MTERESRKMSGDNHRGWTRFYKLVDKLAVPVAGVHEWAREFAKQDRHVGNTRIGGVCVSTVFLGLDHNYFGEPGSLPILFETLVFRGGAGEEMERYESWEQAEAGHKKWVETVRREIKDKVNE